MLSTTEARGEQHRLAAERFVVAAERAQQVMGCRDLPELLSVLAGSRSAK
ncbi:MAG: hypothetical protein HY329_24050 [Chloroflexi bacterium]|nr:hypothetical protein [Chloroflexota bacterium]